MKKGEEQAVSEEKFHFFKFDKFENSCNNAPELQNDFFSRKRWENL